MMDPDEPGAKDVVEVETDASRPASSDETPGPQRDPEKELQRSSSSRGSSFSNFSDRWTRMIQAFMKPILKGLLKITHHAATNPKAYVVTIIVLSLALMLIGLVTNFKLEAEDDVWTPQDTRSVTHGEWIDEESGFPKDPRYAMLIVHRDGKSVLGDDAEKSLAKEGVERVFEVLTVLRSTGGYEPLCSKRDYQHPVTNETTCDIFSITSFWNDDLDFFEESIATDEEAIAALSSKKYPSGRGVDFHQIIGDNRCELEDGTNIECTEGGILSYGLSYITIVGFPGQDETEDEAKDFESDAIDRMKDLQEAWEKEEGNSFRLELLFARSFDDEFLRAMSADFPLLPMVFAVMSILCIVIYARRDPVFSRSWLGFGACVTVLLAIMASFGLLFICGVPFTNLTPILPFIMFGVGLDDAFIISGAYTRTDHWKETPARIRETIEDVGPTILLTTLTASVAFALGMLSSIPAVKFLVAYAFPTIIIDFLYQITFFVALIVLDEQRIKDNRRDCCFCYKDQTPGSQSFRLEQERTHKKHFADRAMIHYGNFLLKPATKVVVLVAFAAMFAVFTYSTTQLTQYFDFTEILPSDSYIQTWWDAFNDYNERNGVRAGIYFRDVDFSLKSTQTAMYDFVQDMVDMPAVSRYPTFDFWLLDFDAYIQDSNLTGLPFEEQLEAFLSVDTYDFHKENIVLDENGIMLTSRTFIGYDNHDYEDIKETVDVLNMQNDISADQPVNKGRKKWAFFTWTEDYYIWEFYKVSPEELILTTILGTVSVTVLAMLFIPHWSAAPIVFGTLVLLYIDLLGFANFCGQSVGPVFYISLVMSIGLMVDYVMHVTYRFIEIPADNREEKTKKTLETIGASVLLGGASTLIGVLPLGFASSEIFFSVFVVFFGLVFLGLLHGLVLLPVILSLIGPMIVIDNAAIVEDEVEPTKNSPDDSSENKPF